MSRIEFSTRLYLSISCRIDKVVDEIHADGGEGVAGEHRRGVRVWIGGVPYAAGDRGEHVGIGRNGSEGRGEHSGLRGRGLLLLLLLLLCLLQGVGRLLQGLLLLLDGRGLRLRRH